jgi:ADP-ribose pyrophosphatase
VVRERGRSGGTEEAAFLTIRRYELSVDLDGAASPPFAYDVVERRALDAAVVVAHFVRDDRRWVVLRSSLRPPFALRSDASPNDGVLWELPAGLVEPGERPDEAAARELNEEIGTRLSAGRMTPLGAAVIPVPAMIAERQHLFHVEIDPAELGEPTGDGSALERASVLAEIALDDALALAREGRLPDAKTELGLRRLAERLSDERAVGS